MARNRNFVWSDSLRNTFLESIRRAGLVATAARDIGTTAVRIRSECEANEEFEIELQDALLVYAESIQAELHRRAVVGVEEDVYFQGEVCGQKTNYSDSLLTTLVKAKSPEFREKIAVDTTIHGGVLLTLPPAQTQSAWIEAATPEQLPAPDTDAPPTDAPEGDVIDVESAEESSTDS